MDDVVAIVEERRKGACTVSHEPTQDCASCNDTVYAASISVNTARAGEKMAREDANEAHRDRRKAEAAKLEVETREFLLYETLGMLLHNAGPAVTVLILDRHPEMKGKHDGD